VKSGRWVYFLCRPHSYVLYLFSAYLGEAAVRFPVNLLIAGSIAFAAAVGLPAWRSSGWGEAGQCSGRMSIVAREMEYRASFAAQVLSMAINDGMWAAFWVLYFARFQSWRVGVGPTSSPSGRSSPPAAAWQTACPAMPSGSPRSSTRQS
jgi:hypothetical protein